MTPCEDEAYGGQELPEIIKFATHEMFFAANFPFMCYVNLTHDAAKLIELFRQRTPKSRPIWRRCTAVSGPAPCA